MYQVALTESLFSAQTASPLPPGTIAEMLREQVTARGTALALREVTQDGLIGREWTYAQLLADSERLARVLALRHSPGARLLVFANNIPEWVLLELATMLAGVTLVTANPALTARELHYVLDQSRAEAVYFVEAVRGRARAPIVAEACAERPQVKCVLMSDTAALFAGEQADSLPATAPGDIAQIQYTFGTTGFPKGALLHQRGILQSAYDAMGRLGMTAGDRVLAMMPLFHTAGCGLAVLGGLSHGAELLLIPAFDAEMIVRVIERERATVVLGVPTMFVALNDIMADGHGGIFRRDASSWRAALWLLLI